MSNTTTFYKASNMGAIQVSQFIIISTFSKNCYNIVNEVTLLERWFALYL